MLRIKPEQLAHFADLARDRFVGMMCTYLREEFPDRVASMKDDALTAWARSGLDFCERVGVTSEPEAAQLMLTLLVLGPAPDERIDWAAAVFRRRELSQEGKVRALIVAARTAGLPIDEVVRYPQYEPTDGELPAPAELSDP